MWTNLGESPLVDLLFIAATLEGRSLYSHKEFERCLWETLADITADRGGRAVPDGALCIMVQMPPICGVSPYRALGQAN